MPRAVNPMPALNFTGTQSEYSPTLMLNVSESISIRAWERFTSARSLNSARSSAGAQRILGTRNVGMKACAIPLDGNSHTALAKLVAANARSAETECALTPFQIGDAHAGEQHAGKLFGRESHWNANHRTENSRLAQPMPERCSAAQAFDLGLAERQRVFADAQVA